MGGARLTVHVTIEPGEGLSGSVVADTSDQAIAFSGWLGLVEAINLCGVVPARSWLRHHWREAERGRGNFEARSGPSGRTGSARARRSLFVRGFATAWPA